MNRLDTPDPVRRSHRAGAGLLRCAVMALIAVAVVATAACAPPPPPPAPADGGPIPPNRPYQALPWTPDDAPKLLEELRAQLDTPGFAARLDPKRRDQILATLRSEIAKPDALSKLQQFISSQNTSAAQQNSKGRLPAPPSAARRKELGLTVPASPPAPPVTVPTVPNVEAPRPTPQIAAATPVQGKVPQDLTELKIVPTGGKWPTGSPSAWTIVGGSLTDALRETLLAGTGNLTPGAPCNTLNTGPRQVPVPEIPAFTGQIFTPAQGTIAAATGATVHHGELITRIDPATGKRQFKVEAHLVSPLSLDPASGLTFDVAAFRGHVVVEQVGAAPRSYFAGSPGTQWRTLCYQQDAGQSKPARAYVEAWIPFEGFAEPGFQVRFETVDNFWAGANPTAFYAADQVTVALQQATGPLAHDAGTPGGSMSLRVDDRVIVDRDANPGNDLESLLTSQLLPLLPPAVEGLQDDWVGIPGLLYIYLTDVNLTGTTLDLDIVPIEGDDEHEFTATFHLGDLQVQGAFGALNACGFSSRVAADVKFTGRVGRTPGDPARLAVDGGSLSTVLNIDNQWVLGPDPFTSLVCWIVWAGGGSIITGLLNEIATAEIAPLADELGDDLDLEIDDVAGPIVTTPTGGGFGVDLLAFRRSCEPRGCQGGDLLLDDDGAVVAADLRVRDGKAAGAPRRFPVVFNPTLSSGLAERSMDLFTTGGSRYDAALTLNPVFLNQILRALAEGGVTPGTGTLDADGSSGGTSFTVDAEVAPVVVTQQVFPDQPPLTVFVPDLRISDGTTTFAVNAVVGVGLDVDASSRRLLPRLEVGVDVDTLSCPVGRRGSTPDVGILVSYNVCANRDWAGTPGHPTLPSIAELLNYVVNGLVNPLLRDSIGEIEIPTVSGFDLAALGDIRVESRNGFPTLYLGVKRSGLNVTPWGTASTLTVFSTARGLPGSGPITYDVRIADRNSAAVVDPPPGTSGVVSVPAADFRLGGPFVFGLGFRRVAVTVSASRGGTTFTTTEDYLWAGPV